MSEYNRFLKHFNNQNTEEADPSLSEREDIIPVHGAPAASSPEDAPEAAPEAAPVLSGEAPPEAASDPEAIPAQGESTDSIPKGRFMRQGEAQFISVNGKNNDVPTTATKYTDRLLPGIPEKKAPEIAEPKTNTYADNHAPQDTERKIIPASDPEKEDARKNTEEKNTPAATAQSQTRILPRIIDGEEEENEAEAGVIVEKLPENDDKTKPLQAKGRLLREIAKTSDGDSEDIIDDDQLKMDGFSEEDNEKIPDITDEAALKEELSKVREKRINSFRFWTKSAVETGESDDKSFSPGREEKKLPDFLISIRKKFEHLDTDFTPIGEEEYQDPSRRKEIFNRLIEARKTTIIKAFIVGVVGIIILLINIAANLSAEMNNGFFTIFGGSAVAYNIVNLIALLATGIIMADELKKGLFSILKVRPKTDSALLIMFVGALAQNIAAFFTILKPESEYHMLTGAVIILAASVLAAKTFYLDSTRHCFKAVGTTSDKCYLRKISDEELISRLLKDSSTTETNVVYTGKTRFISNFLKRSASAAFAGQVSSRIVLASAAAAAVACIIGLIATRSPVYALGCFTLTSAFSFPVSCLIFTGFAIAAENNTLSVKASFVGSYNDAYSFYCIDDIILSGEDIFSAEVVSSTCSSNVSQKQAEFCAAVISNKAGGILGKAFSVFSQGLEDRYPEVEGLSIEDKLGFSAWISDCRVLLGTKQFLINHNVELPAENTVPFVLDESTKPLFLAIEGHFAAVFCVKYSCHTTTAKSLCSLASNGANILISISDPNITEEFGEDILGLPRESLRIMKKDANEDFIKSRNTVTDCEDTGIVFSDSFEAFARTIEGAVKLEKFRRVAKAMTEAVSIAGMLLGILLSATSALSLMSGWPVVFIQVCMVLITFAATPLLAATAIKKKIALPENVTERIRQSTSSVDKELFDMYGEKEEKAAKTEESAENTQTKESDDAVADVNSADEESTDEEIADEADEDDIFDLPEKAQRRKTADRIRRVMAAAGKNKEKNTPAPEGEQMIMQGAPYTEPPQVVDFSKIAPTEEKEVSEEEAKTTITDDILDLFAEPEERVKPAPRKAPSKSGLFDKLGFGSKNNSSTADEEPEEEKKPSVFGSLFRHEENIAPPPRFNLNKKEDENDPLKAEFIPPETQAPSTLYKDDFFASFDTGEDDKAFADIRRQREEAENHGADEFDFWTTKEEGNSEEV